MSLKPQPNAGAGLNNDEFSFLDRYVDPDWSTVVDPAQNVGEANFFAGLPDFTKDPIFMEPLPFDLGLYMNNISGESPSISTKDIFTPVTAQPTAGTSINPAATTFEPSLGAFSDSASPADSHSPTQSASANVDDMQSDSEEDSEEEDDFKAPKRGSTSKGRATSASVKNKRAANKPKPYPRVSDVVRDAPHKLADGKRQPASTELKGSVRTSDAADDDWRPTMEEYQKMSSKEKRQLRNKISARNFRVRRKEYITTLEGEVAARDQQLQTYREELTNTRSENTELKKEIERLKREILEGRGGASIFEQADSKVGILSETNTKNTRSKVVVRANRNKDLPSTGSTRGFWGGSTMGGATSVHTTLIPEFDISTLSGKPRLLQENLNPLLNSNNLNEETYTHANVNANMPLFTSGLDGLHNFTFKGLDSDRMQLWSRMAREAGAAQAQKDKLVASPASSTNSSLGSSGYSSSGVLSNANVGPLFFSSPATQLVKKDAGKALSVGSPTPSQAVLATSISQTITGKLMGALWGAFAPKSTLDMDKVKKVLEGKAELRVVDVENSSAAALEEGLKAMSLVGPASTSPKKTSVEVLEESLKGMSLSASTATRKELIQKKDCSSAVGIFARPMRAGHTPTPAHQPTSKHAVTAQH